MGDQKELTPDPVDKKEPFTAYFKKENIPSPIKPEPTYHEPETAYHEPKPTYNEPKPTYRPPVIPTYHSPKPTYKEPEPAYQPPEPTYHRPEPTYQEPEPAYHEPKPAYNKPEPTYFEPEPTYNAPEPSYHEPDPAYQAGFHPSVHAVPAKPYSFEYAVADHNSHANFAAAESSLDDGGVAGSYSVALPDGRTQHVSYVAHEDVGYKATVTYEGDAKFPIPSAPYPHVVQNYQPTHAPYVLNDEK